MIAFSVTGHFRTSFWTHSVPPSPSDRFNMWDFCLLLLFSFPILVLRNYQYYISIIVLVCLLCNFCIFDNCSLSFKIYNMCYCVL